MAPKHYTPEQLAHLDEMNAPDYQYNPGWETDHIAWVPYAEVVKDMQENSEEYHPGMLKLFHNSKDAIERALKIEPEPEKQGAVKVAWKEIAIEENDPKAEDPLKGNLLGGILESDADLKAWAEHEIDLPPKRERQRLNFVKKFHGKRMAVVDDMRVFDRGKGWGTKIITNFIEQAKAANCDGIILQAGIFEKQQKGFDLVDWYGRLGFKTLGHSGELPLMVKWLKAQGKTSAFQSWMKPWLTGGCWQFAIALSHRMPDTSFVGLAYESGVVHHVGLVKGDTYYDVRGAMDEDEFNYGTDQGDTVVHMTYEEVLTEGEFGSWIGHEDEFNNTSEMKEATKAVNKAFGKVAGKNCPSGKKKFFDEVSAIGPQKHWDKGTPQLRAYKCPT